MISCKVKIDKSNLKKIFNCIRADSIFVGYPSGIMHNKSPIELSDLAQILSEGSAYREATPFLIDGLNWNKERLIKAIEKSYKSVCKTGKPLTNMLGQEMMDGIKRFVMGGNTPYTKLPATIKAETAKSSATGADKTTPLVDTGQLINALTYVVKEKKKKVNK